MRQGSKTVVKTEIVTESNGDEIKKTFELFDIEKPTEEDYIILESLEKKVYYGYIKLIHVIKFMKKKSKKINMI